MLKNSFPAFMCPIRSTRRHSSKNHQFDTYQRLAAIYLLRLILGLQKSLKRIPLLIVLRDEVRILTGLDEHLTEEEDEDELDQDNITNKIPLHKASKAAMLKCVRRRLDELLAEGIDANMALFENIKLIGQTLKLNNAEQEILILLLLMPLIEPFRDKVTHLCLDCTLQSTVDYLRVMTTRSVGEIRKALQPNADITGLPLHIKRASDLLDKYVGESEKNIATMFEEAETQGGILLLDEADSLLADRNHAQRQWEITQVNEMLTQMETFTGIFICTTNLMDKLDAASLRRFDFKVKFDYLNPQQRWALFQQECQRLGSLVPTKPENLAILKQQVQRLTKLTPGDFAVLSRQVAVLGAMPQPERMVQVLEQECKAKGETFSQIGFVR